LNRYFPQLFSPITIKNVRFKNRILSAPHFLPRVTSNYYPDDDFIRFYEDKAKGGAAAVAIPDGILDIETSGSGGSWLRLDRRMFPRMVEVCNGIKQYGAVATFQLGNGGMFAPGYDGKGNIGPSKMVLPDGTYIREMTVDQMNVYADSFARAAVLLKKAGFDMIQIHGGHGAMFTQWLSPEYNKRTDEYGGSIENRARFPIMVIDRIRDAIGDDMLIEYRYSGDEMCENGYTLSDGVEFAKLIQDKVDIIHVSAARASNKVGIVITHPTIFLDNGCNVYMAEAVKKAVHTPVAAIGGITTPELAEEIIAQGKADFVALARAIIADPQFPNKARLGKRDEITPCIRCLNCLNDEETRDTFHCAVNPPVGHANRFDHIPKKSDNPQRVVIVGGGVAGLSAAITASERGHSVTLLEKSAKLGGILKFTDNDGLKLDLCRYKNYLIRRAKQLNVKTKLNTEATAVLVASLQPDTVIVASGSTPAVPNIQGLAEHAKHVLEIYTDNAPNIGKCVLILGGGLAGCETAVELARRGHTVEVVEMLGKYASDAHFLHFSGLEQEIERLKITVHTNTACLSVDEGGATVRNKSGEEKYLAADSVLYALGMKPNSAVLTELEDVAPNVIAVGDCVKPRQVEQAVYEGYFAALNL